MEDVTVKQLAGFVARRYARKDSGECVYASIVAYNWREVMTILDTIPDTPRPAHWKVRRTGPVPPNTGYGLILCRFEGE